MTLTARGSVHQRHTRRCPRPEDGSRGYAEHKCRGPWAWHLDLGDDPVTGKRVQRTGSGYVTMREAATALEVARARLAITGGRSEGMTVGAWLDSWLTSLHTASPTTIARYESTIRLHLRPLLGGLQLAVLAPEDIDRLIAVVSDPVYAPSGRTSARYASQQGLSSASINRIYDTLRSALAVATRRRLIPWNPASVVTPPPERNQRGTAWTPAEAAQFLDASTGHRLYAAWHLVLLAGARRGEIAGATWDAVDLDGKVWSLETARVQVGGTVYEKSPKTAAGTRRVYLDAETVQVLRGHRRRQAEERLAAGPGWEDSGRLFVTRIGTPIPPGSLTASWRAACLAAGLPVIRLHDGRHTSVTAASEHSGVSDQVLIERVGHSQVTTNRRYRHVHEESHRQAAERIAETYRQYRRPGPDAAANDA